MDAGAVAVLLSLALLAVVVTSRWPRTLRSAAFRPPGLRSAPSETAAHQGCVKRPRGLLKPGAVRHLMGDVNSAWLLLDRPPHPADLLRAPRCPETSASC